MSSATVEKPMASESAICQAGGGSVTMRAIIVIGADRKSTRLNSSHSQISYAVFCLKKKKKQHTSAILRSHRHLCVTHITLDQNCNIDDQHSCGDYAHCSRQYTTQRTYCHMQYSNC